MIDWSKRKYTKQQFIDAWNNYSSYNECRTKLGLSRGRENQRLLEKTAAELGMKNTKFTPNPRCKPAMKSTARKITKENMHEFFTKGDTPMTSSMNRFIRKNSLLGDTCSICGIEDEDLTLQIDHIDGDNTNNSLNNLRMLCPNCHSQTETFSHRNVKRTLLNNDVCSKCGKPVSKNSKICRECLYEDSWKSEAGKPIYWHYYNFTEDQFIKEFKGSRNYTECARKLEEKYGQKVDIGKVSIFGKRLALDTSHMSHVPGLSDKKKQEKKTAFIEKYLVENSSKPNRYIKPKIIEYNIIEYRCNVCHNSGSWMNLELSLHLDHINGNSRDNRIENLQFLCPNCHSKTETYCKSKSSLEKKTIKKKKIQHATQKEKGENIKKTKEKGNKKEKLHAKPKRQRKKEKPSPTPCPSCGGVMSRRASLCRECASSSSKPTKEQLTENIIMLNANMSAVGRMYNVSDSAVRKWLKSYNMPTKVRDLRAYVQGVDA